MQTLRDAFSSLTFTQRWWLGGGLAAVLVLFAVVIVATGGGDLPPETTTTTEIAVSTTSTSTTTTSTTTTTTTVVSTAETWPLTGLPAGDGSEPAPVLAAKIDNTTAARPQVGLEQADLVFDIPVEGGISRLLALYQSQLPDEIGPIRSVREVDAKLLAPFDALLAFSGGNAPIVSSVLEVAVDLGHPTLGTTAYRRAGDRPAPYDLFFNTEAALTTLDEPVTQEELRLVFGPSTSDEEALTIEIESSTRHRVTYGYSAADGGYLRFHEAQPHLAASGDQLVATNVIILEVDQLETGRTDSSGAPVPDFDVFGTGEAALFREGMALAGRWERGRAGDFFRLFDGSGREISLASGTTWIHLVPAGRTYEWR